MTQMRLRLRLRLHGPNALLQTPSRSTRRAFSNTRPLLTGDVVNLAFQRHDPPEKPNAAEARPPIIIMHGLFGSQRNNRTMSK